MDELIVWIGFIGAIVGIIWFLMDPRIREFLRLCFSKLLQYIVDTNQGVALPTYTKSDSELWTVSTILSRHDVLVEIHQRYALTLDDHYVASAFRVHNHRRLNRGLFEQFPAIRYRVIRPPILHSNTLKLDVAPINFVYFALLMDSTVEQAVKDYINKKIDDLAQRIPQNLRSDHPYINGRNYRLLGVEMVLITSDGRTLLRKRGQSVATATDEWDVSFSGYCGHEDLRGSKLKVGLTVEHELEEEIEGEAILSKDPMRIYFTGFHLNKKILVTDLLGYWKIEASTDQVVRCLLGKKPHLIPRKFRTTETKGLERYVWDGENLIVEFDGNKIASALEEVGAGIDQLIPEAREALRLALEAEGKPVDGLAA